ncbi:MULTISPECIES: S24 family peptidase [unclassified Nocardioides]|uniref:S24 family peptidase n=1 Tax=unclassified Nocardioides TaxID=2615069 RepID=UPI00005719E9|nr:MULTISPECIES: S24 family peptidase [unclassified Nocardioides]ABL81239.1 peptidase S24, S26A and S26B [Nocardioides sp. JS614]
MERGPRWGFAVVSGRSMTPLLAPGDRLLVSYRRPARPGAVVVARLADGTVAVKRAAQRRTTRTGQAGWWLLSDNPDEGVDSRHRGVVPDDQVLAVVTARIWPRPRRLRAAVPD